MVLILGRFTPERKAVLDALRDELRKPGRNYVPAVFDFEKPRSQTTVETVTLLARMARFIIADISDAKSVLQELQAIVPNSPKLPVQLSEGETDGSAKEKGGRKNPAGAAPSIDGSRRS